MITSNLTGVVCGNSDVLLDQLIDEGVHFDLILTDPPYNINKDFGNKSDCLPLDEFIAITAERMAKIKKLLEPQGSVLWFGIHDYIGFVQVAMYNAGLHYRRMNIWHYENGFSRSKKEPATHYEPFLWFSNNPKKWTYNVDDVRRSSIFHKRKNENMGEVSHDYLCDVWQSTSQQFVGKSCGQCAHK